jgi:hypothetical protein
MRGRTRFGMGILALGSLFVFMPSTDGFPNHAQNLLSMRDMQSSTETKNGVVYVCACLKTKSCFCMTEAKMEGPCACGTQGGPPMKAVASDSAWAKENRDALSK